MSSALGAGRSDGLAVPPTHQEQLGRGGSLSRCLTLTGLGPFLCGSCHSCDSSCAALFVAGLPGEGAVPTPPDLGSNPHHSSDHAESLTARPPGTLTCVAFISHLTRILSVSTSEGFRAAPTAYGGSQARHHIGAAPAGLCHSHSNEGS